MIQFHWYNCERNYEIVTKFPRNRFLYTEFNSQFAFNHIDTIVKIDGELLIQALVKFHFWGRGTGVGGVEEEEEIRYEILLIFWNSLILN